MEHHLQVGQLVLYVASEGAPFPRRRYPAIVVHVEDAAAGVVNLTVFADVVETGAVARLRVPYAGDHQPGSWHYPDSAPAGSPATGSVRTVDL